MDVSKDRGNSSRLACTFEMKEYRDVAVSKNKIESDRDKTRRSEKNDSDITRKTMKALDQQSGDMHHLVASRLPVSNFKGH